jgi:hypothetical protein
LLIIARLSSLLFANSSFAAPPPVFESCPPGLPYLSAFVPPPPHPSLLSFSPALSLYAPLSSLSSHQQLPLPSPLQQQLPQFALPPLQSYTAASSSSHSSFAPSSSSPAVFLSPSAPSAAAASSALAAVPSGGAPPRPPHTAQDLAGQEFLSYMASYDALVDFASEVREAVRRNVAFPC